MIAVLNQKRGLNYRKHTLFTDKVVVETRSTTKVEKYEIRIEKLGFQIQYQADNTIYRKALLAICVVIPIALTISHFILHNVDARSLIVNYICSFGIALFSVLKQHQDDIYLTGGEKTLAFYRNIPQEEKVLEFIALVNKTTKDHIKNKYLTFDPSTPDEEYLARMNWLKENDIISEEECEEYKLDFEIKRLFS